MAVSFLFFFFLVFVALLGCCDDCELLDPAIIVDSRMNFVPDWLVFLQASLFGLLTENFLMDQCRSIEANAFVSFEEMRGYLSISDRRGLVACPKPRRVGLSSSSLLRSQFSHRSEVGKSREGADLLNLILKKEDFEFEQQSPAVTALMTPFYSGPPPCRADNPLAQDTRFRNGVIPPIAASPDFSLSSLLPSSSPPPTLKGCVRMKFGPKPASVRVEGFDCLSRDGQNSSVPAIA